MAFSTGTGLISGVLQGSILGPRQYLFKWPFLFITRQIFLILLMTPPELFTQVSRIHAKNQRKHHEETSTTTARQGNTCIICELFSFF